MQFESHTYADCSTAHIPKEDSLLLSRAAHNFSLTVTTHEYEEGFWVHVPSDDMKEAIRRMTSMGFSLAMIALMRLAREQGHNWLRLDRDGAIYEELETFDW